MVIFDFIKTCFTEPLKGPFIFIHMSISNKIGTNNRLCNVPIVRKIKKEKFLSKIFPFLYSKQKSINMIHHNNESR